MDRVAIVTGGGRGIGASTAAALSREGYSVCVNYQSNHARAQEVISAIGRAGGREAAGGGPGGFIFSLGFVVARIGGAGEFTPYAASKGAIESLTFSLAQEVAAEGIRVVGVSPGIIDRKS